VALRKSDMVIPPAWPMGPSTLFTRIEELTNPTFSIALDRVAGAFFEFFLRQVLWLRKRPRILLEAVIVSDIDWTKRQDKKEKMGKNMSCWPSVRQFHTVVVPYYL
jgi:hypothetical protein